MVDFPNMDAVHPQTAVLPSPMQHPQQGQIAQYGQPQRSIMRTLGTFTGGGFFFVFLLIVADLVFMPSLKPSQLWGEFTGNVQRAQIETSGPATVTLEQQLANVRAQEQAKAQEQVARVQSQLDTTREAYASLYKRGDTFIGQYLEMQKAMQQYRAEAVRAGSAGGGIINMGTGFMCAMSRANGDGDPDGWCTANDRVRQGQVQDINGGVGISREQLQQELFGDLPDPAMQRVRADQKQSANWQLEPDQPNR